MKLLIIGIDAMSPDILFENITRFPNIQRLCESGVYGDYDGYAYGYGSSDNWITLYTGLTPKQHGVKNNQFNNNGRQVRREDYADKDPFWEVLNDNGYKVGIWKALNSSPPSKVNGYMISGEPNFELDWMNDPLTNIMPVFCEEDKELEQYILGKLDRPPMPKGPEYFGSSWEEIFKQNDIADTILSDNYYYEIVDYLEKSLSFYSTNIVNMQANNPVDLVFFYTPLLDLIQHFQSHDQSKKVIFKSMEIIDRFIGELMSEVEYDNIIVLSDHGIRSFKDLFPDMSIDLQKECFGFADKSIWLKNGSIIAKARNFGLISCIHEMKGCFIASGQNFRKGKIDSMRSIDFYPTLLELLNIKTPLNREGYVLDIFENKQIINEDKLITKYNHKIKNIAIIQDMEVPEFNRIINEVYLDNRFAIITIFGEEKYKNVFQCNPRVSYYKIIEDGILDMNKLQEYDKIFLSYRNNKTNELNYIIISKNVKE